MGSIFYLVYYMGEVLFGRASVQVLFSVRHRNVLQALHGSLAHFTELRTR